MAWRRPGDKPLSEAMVVSLLTHVCVVRPQLAPNADQQNIVAGTPALDSRPAGWALHVVMSLACVFLLTLNNDNNNDNYDESITGVKNKKTPKEKIPMKVSLKTKARKPRPSNINGTEVILKARYVRNLCRLYFCANILQHNSRWKCVYSSDREGQGLFQGQSTGPHSYHNDSPHGKAVSGGRIASGVTKLLL